MTNTGYLEPADLDEFDKVTKGNSDPVRLLHLHPPEYSRLGWRLLPVVAICMTHA